MADAFHVMIALVGEIAVFDDRKSIRSFCVRTPRIGAMSNTACNMQQTTINFSQVQTQPVRTLRERISEVSMVVNQWLDTRSRFYSRIAEFAVTRRTALRVNLVTLAAIIGAVCVEQSPLVAVMAAASAGWIVYRLNRKGGSK